MTATTISKTRHWWLAALLGFFGMGTGYLYVGRPSAAISVSVALVFVSTAIYFGAFGAAATPIVFYVLVLIALLLVVWSIAAPAIIAARTHDYRLRSFNRLWVYAGWIASSLLFFNILIEIGPTVRTYRIGSESGLPTTLPGDVVYADMTAFANSVPTRGELVLFARHDRYSSQNQNPYVSRVIGLPGERVKVAEGVISINGEQVELQVTNGAASPERNGVIYDETLPGGARYQILRLGSASYLATIPERTVAPGCYFLISDNRDNSIDSRLFGDICADQIIGAIRWIVWSSDWTRLGIRLD